MFTLIQLESFVAVAEELHYGRAAERLSMTQPPLSRRIQLLEHELGVELLDRGRRGVRLTPAGRAFLSDARRLLDHAQEAALSVRQVQAGTSGSVALGFTAATAYSFLGQLLDLAGTELPGVDLVLREMVSGAQLAALQSGELDLALARPPVGGDDITTIPLLREPLLLAAPQGHPLAERADDPDIGELDGQPFVMFSPSESRYFHEVLVGVFREAGVAPRYVQHSSQVHTVLGLVRARLGIALVPAAAAALHLDDLVLRPIGGIRADPVELVAAWRTGNDNPALAALVATVREHVPDRRT